MTNLADLARIGRCAQNDLAQLVVQAVGDGDHLSATFVPGDVTTQSVERGRGRASRPVGPVVVHAMWRVDRDAVSARRASDESGRRTGHREDAGQGNRGKQQERAPTPDRRRRRDRRSKTEATNLDLISGDDVAGDLGFARVECAGGSGQVRRQREPQRPDIGEELVDAAIPRLGHGWCFAKAAPGSCRRRRARSVMSLPPATMTLRCRREPGRAEQTEDRVSDTAAIGVEDVTLAFLGGTGDQGRGLARRFSLAGHRVIIGSRQAERAESAAAELGASCPDPSLISGLPNADAAAAADVVVIAVPWDGHEQLVRAVAPALRGKIVVDCVNPMGFDSQGAYAVEVAEGSAAQQAAAILSDSTVVAAFHHVSAVLLLDPDVGSIDTDVLVLGDDRAATDLIQALVDRIEGMRGVYGGRLRNARQIEAFTANLVSINRRYKAHAGLRVTDV
jgi:NADPH-dependent F420 reductase